MYVPFVVLLSPSGKGSLCISSKIKHVCAPNMEQVQHWDCKGTASSQRSTWLVRCLPWLWCYGAISMPVIIFISLSIMPWMRKPCPQRKQQPQPSAFQSTHQSPTSKFQSHPPQFTATCHACRGHCLHLNLSTSHFISHWLIKRCVHFKPCLLQNLP